MAKEVKKLKAVQINSLSPGMHSDGDNLFLRVRESGSRSWVFRYKQNGRAIELGLEYADWARQMTEHLLKRER